MTPRPGVKIGLAKKGSSPSILVQDRESVVRVGIPIGICMASMSGVQVPCLWRCSVRTKL
eukprot:5652653-Amphidinium_carterae.2